MSESGAESQEAGHNPPTCGPKVSTMVQGEVASEVSTNLAKVLTTVPTNVFTETLQGTLGFTTAQIKALVEDGYDTQEALLYWKFIDIKEWCQLKYNTHVIKDGIFLEIGR